MSETADHVHPVETNDRDRSWEHTLALYAFDADAMFERTHELRDRAASVLSVLDDAADGGELRPQTSAVRGHMDDLLVEIHAARENFRAAERWEYRPRAYEDTPPDPEIDTHDIAATRTGIGSHLICLREDLAQLGERAATAARDSRDEQWPQTVPEIDDRRRAPAQSGFYAEFGTHCLSETSRVADDAAGAIATLHARIEPPSIEHEASASDFADAAGDLLGVAEHIQQRTHTWVAGIGTVHGTDSRLHERAASTSEAVDHTVLSLRHVTREFDGFDNPDGPTTTAATSAAEDHHTAAATSDTDRAVDPDLFESSVAGEGELLACDMEDLAYAVGSLRAEGKDWCTHEAPAYADDDARRLAHAHNAGDALDEANSAAATASWKLAEIDLELRHRDDVVLDDQSRSRDDDLLPPATEVLPGQEALPFDQQAPVTGSSVSACGAAVQRAQSAVAQIPEHNQQGHTEQTTHRYIDHVNQTADDVYVADRGND